MMHLTQVRYFTCPPGCYKEGLETIGAIIHPSEASICIAAWADRSINHNGGVIQVVVTKAQTSYQHHFWKKLNGITLAGGGTSSLFGFITAKVDNSDMIGKKIRLINKDKVDAKGRLEIVVERQWITVKPTVFPKVSESQDSMMSRVAASACKYLGYPYGVMDGTDTNDLNEFVPQRMIYCHMVNDSFPCEMKLPDGTPDDPPPVEPADHSSDVKVQCIKIDPTQSKKGGGGLFTPYAGLEGN